MRDVYILGEPQTQDTDESGLTFELQTDSFFELLKNLKYYFSILFKTVWRKNISKICRPFIIQYKINKSNTKVLHITELYACIL